MSIGFSTSIRSEFPGKVNIAMAKKIMDIAEIQGEKTIEMLEEMTEVANPNVGKNIDVKV